MYHESPLTFFLRSIGLPPQQLLLCMGDTLTLVLVSTLALCLRALFGNVNMDMYIWMLPIILCLTPLLGFLFGLYQTLPLPPHRELRSLCLTSSLVFGLLLLYLFMSKSSGSYSRLAILGAWLLSLLALPCWRYACRRLLCRARWWGAPLIILDQSRRGKDFWHYLRRNPQYGLSPRHILSLPRERNALVAVLSDRARRTPNAIALFLQSNDRTSIEYLAHINRFFSKTLVVPHFGGQFQHFWLTPCDLGLHTGLLLRQNLRSRWRQRLKRLVDMSICVPLAALLLLPGLLLGLAIRLDSPGPALYRQRRLGKGGRTIFIYKFRTMVSNADAVLHDYLETQPELRAEWERDQKLRHDPRITRMGRFLRKTSLDELPQLLNVLRGEMSLVGPRPIVDSEKEKYGLVYENYCRVRPGITGLWQVSGRNNTTYEERVSMDDYYVTNWSVWMDLWILGKTPLVVLTGYGAY